MDNKENNIKEEGFSYRYSAKEQKEIQDIRRKYTPGEEKEDKMTELRRLDASVTEKGTIVSLVIGIISALIMGIGMCSCMLWADRFFIVGIIVGLVGIAGVALSYPVYSAITKKERERIAPEIIRLTDELMK